MGKYQFQLHFQLPESEPDAEAWLDALFEAGCDDALVGINPLGQVALDFSRAAESPLQALISAIRDVKRAIPGSCLINTSPDLMNLSEIAELLSSQVATITRQAMRKYAAGEIKKSKTRFPAPLITGHTPLWHLDEVLGWMLENGKIANGAKQKAETLTVIASINKVINATCGYIQTQLEYPAIAKEATLALQA